MRTCYTLTLSALCTIPSLGYAQDSQPRGTDTVIVTGRSYNDLSATSATKTNTPLLRTPQSVQVVTEALIDDRRPVTLTEALYNASGVTDGGGRRATFDFPLIRGFDASTDLFLDGLRIERGSTNFSYELLGLERIEVLKGPSSVLFGQGALGGVVNQMSRRPSRDARVLIEGGLGAFDYSQLRVDATGPLGDTVSGRIVGVHRSSDDFVDFMNKERLFVAPSLSWDISDRTRITFLSAYTKDETDGSYIGLPAEGTVLPNINGAIPRERNVREPAYDRLEIERSQIGYSLEHSFSSDFVLRQNLRYSSADVLSNLTVALYLDPDERTLNRGVGAFRNADRSLAVDTHFELHRTAGQVEHTLLFGLDYLRQDVDQSFAFGFQSSIDLYTPVYGQPVGPIFPPGVDFNRRDDLAGIYVQDQIAFGERFDLLLGARLDSTDTNNDDFANQLSTEQSDDAFVPRVGGVYRFTDALSGYFNYSQSFLPTFGVAFSGEQFDVEEGDIVELGVKSALLNGRFNATFALYEIERTNVLTSDPDPLHAGFSIATGEQRSRGFDADISFDISDAWNIAVAYADTDVKITRDTDYAGQRPINVPKQQFNVYSQYEFAGGFGVGLGARHVGEREGSLPNTYKLPSYTTVDGTLRYTNRNLRLQANIYNLFDEDYFPSSASTGGIGVLVGEPRTVRLSIGYEF